MSRGRGRPRKRTLLTGTVSEEQARESMEGGKRAILLIARMMHDLEASLANLESNSDSKPDQESVRRLASVLREFGQMADERGEDEYSSLWPAVKVAETKQLLEQPELLDLTLGELEVKVREEWSDNVFGGGLQSLYHERSMTEQPHPGLSPQAVRALKEGLSQWESLIREETRLGPPKEPTKTAVKIVTAIERSKDRSGFPETKYSPATSLGQSPKHPGGLNYLYICFGGSGAPKAQWVLSAIGLNSELIVKAVDIIPNGAGVGAFDGDLPETWGRYTGPLDTSRRSPPMPKGKPGRHRSKPDQ